MDNPEDHVDFHVQHEDFQHMEEDFQQEYAQEENFQQGNFQQEGVQFEEVQHEEDQHEEGQHEEVQHEEGQLEEGQQEAAQQQPPFWTNEPKQPPLLLNLSSTYYAAAIFVLIPAANFEIQTSWATDHGIWEYLKHVVSRTAATLFVSVLSVGLFDFAGSFVTYLRDRPIRKGRLWLLVKIAGYCGIAIDWNDHERRWEDQLMTARDNHTPYWAFVFIEESVKMVYNFVFMLFLVLGGQSLSRFVKWVFKLLVQAEYLTMHQVELVTTSKFWFDYAAVDNDPWVAGRLVAGQVALQLIIFALLYLTYFLLQAMSEEAGVMFQDEPRRNKWQLWSLVSRATAYYLAIYTAWEILCFANEVFEDLNEYRYSRWELWDSPRYMDPYKKIVAYLVFSLVASLAVYLVNFFVRLIPRLLMSCCRRIWVPVADWQTIYTRYALNRAFTMYVAFAMQEMGSWGFDRQQAWTTAMHAFFVIEQPLPMELDNFEGLM